MTILYFFKTDIVLNKIKLFKPDFGSHKYDFCMHLR